MGKSLPHGDWVFNTPGLYRKLSTKSTSSLVKESLSFLLVPAVVGRLLSADVSTGSSRTSTPERCQENYWLTGLMSLLRQLVSCRAKLVRFSRILRTSFSRLE